MKNKKCMKKFVAHPACIIFLYIALLSLFASCSNDDKGDTSPIISDKSVHEKIVNAVNTSLVITNITEGSVSTSFILSDNSKIELLKRHNIIDITESNAPTIQKSANNTWILNGTDLNIPVISGNTDNIRIICTTYDSEIATFYLSDGSTLEIDRSPVFSSFSFISGLNEGLDEDVTATISNSSIGIKLGVPSNVSLKSLTATFSFSGKSVKIGETEQISGVTKNDFSQTVTYSLYTKKGIKVDCKVTVTNNAARIPTIYIDTENKASIIDKENYVRTSVRIEDPDKMYTDGKSFSSEGGIRGRGNSTWGMPKRPYRIKLDNKASLLGLSNDKDWALLANYADKTLLRNVTAFEISRIADMSWTPSSLSVELYLNGYYQGVYCLTEHVKVSKERLNIDLVKSTDNSGEALTGDYFLELDFHADEKHFKTALKQLPIMYKDPDEPTSQQEEYVQNYFNTAERVLYSSEFTDPDEGYRKYIDMESFINYYIIHELSKNVDGNMRGSCYLSLRRNGKIEQPLVWDFDIAFGNANHITTEQGASSVGWDGWYIKTHSPWFDQFFKDPVFVQALKSRWNQLKPELDQLPSYIREHAKELDEAQKRNFASRENGGAGWNINEVMWPNYIDRGSYGAEIDYLVTFVEKRLEWLNTNINGL